MSHDIFGQFCGFTQRILWKIIFTNSVRCKDRMDSGSYMPLLSRLKTLLNTIRPFFSVTMNPAPITERKKRH